MKAITLTIDGIRVEAKEEETILEAARKAAIYIPALCAYPNLPSVPGRKPTETVYVNGELVKGTDQDKEFEGCQLCVIEIEGKGGLSLACNTLAAEGMVVHTNTPQLKELRRINLAKILANHPHACLTCSQKEGCSITQCSSNVPEKERCCPKFNYCELRKVAEYVGTAEGISRYTFQNLPTIEQEPLFTRDYNLCIGCLRCVRICHDLRGISALSFIYHNGEVLVGTVAPSLKESGCKFCGACVEVCPTGALTDKVKVSKANPEETLVPCRYSCPGGIDIPRLIRFIAEGKFTAAAAVIREKVPLLTVLGHVCPRPCERVCRRGEINEPVAICALKRFAIEQDTGVGEGRAKAPPSGKKVAIIGSGPAGLTAAYYLAKLGHSVTIFEALSQPGGMLRIAIPRYHLPEEVLQQEVDAILALGIELKLNSSVENLIYLLEANYEAIFIATGLQQGRKLPIPGAEADGVYIGLSFLQAVNSGRKVKLGKKILVIGGGGVACDVARTARRLGMPEVHMACLESREDMPALPWEIEEAEKEGIIIHPSRTFTKILTEDGRVSGVKCKSVKWMKFDEEGKLHLETIEGSEHILPADTVIFAIGQAFDPSLISEISEIKFSKRGTIVVNPDTLETERKGIFAGGDIVSGPASVIEAIAAGKKAAISIDKYLGGEGIIEEKLVEPEEPNPWLGRDEGFAYWLRAKMPSLSVEERLQGFDEVELGFRGKEAIEEARRCLRCDLRLKISPPIFPPEEWLNFEVQNISLVPETEGVFQLLDESKSIIYIKGTMNLRRELEEQLESNEQARYFKWEEEPMYTKRESELLQQFLQQHGRLPPQNDELAGLF